MIEVKEYVDEFDRSPFADWFNSLHAQAASKVATAVARIEMGNLSNLKSVGAGVHEYRINAGPGYRIYVGRDGEKLIMLLGGGSKTRQQRDIEDAQEMWRAYKRRKREER